MTSILRRTTALAALAALPLAPLAVQAQSQDDTRQQAQQQAGEQVQQQAGGAQDKAQDEAQDKSQSQDQAQEQAQTGTQMPDQPDQIVARVGDADIMSSDVLAAIAALPPELQRQPAEMLIPMAIDQLVLRELILQEAREMSLDQDAEVLALAPDDSPQARENAMVRVWLDRALAGAVTDEKVDDSYGAVQSQLGDQAPPLATIRPQIEQELRRQRFAEISGELQADAEVTFFGPDGEPLTR